MRHWKHWNVTKKKVAKLKEEFHDEACNKNYNSESTLKYAILLGY